MITVAYEINTYIDVSIDTAAVKKKNIVNFSVNQTISRITSYTECH